MVNERRKYLKRTGLVILGATGVLGTVKQGLAKQETKPAMLINLDRCIGCHSCVIACKEENHSPQGFFNTTIKTLQRGSFPKAWQSYIPQLCRHCEDPACIKACRYDATFKTDSGMVVIDWAKCVGDGACFYACPYQARFLDPNNDNKADKCDFCLSRQEEGLEPACVDACSSGARIFGDLNNPSGEFLQQLEKYKKNRAKNPEKESSRVLYTLPQK